MHRILSAAVPPASMRRFASSASSSSSLISQSSTRSFIIRPASSSSHRHIHTAVAASSDAASASIVDPLSSSPVPAVPSAPVRSLLLASIGAGLPLRLQRLSHDIPSHRKATKNDKGKWEKAKLSAIDLHRMRRADLFSGGTWSEFDVVRLRRIEPVVLKGRKREQVLIDRKLKIAAAMVDMEDRIDDHHRNERARRVRPTMYQAITGKKPSGVIAAEEAAMKLKKEKNKAREQARQAAATK